MVKALAGRGGSVDQSAGHGPAAELVAVRKLQLAEHRADVRLDGLHRDVEAQRDLLVEIAARDETQDLALAGGELIELRVDLLGRQFSGKGIQHESGKSRREDSVAIADALHGVRELLA